MNLKKEKRKERKIPIASSKACLARLQACSGEFITS